MTKKLTQIICLFALPGFLIAQNQTDVTVSGLVANKSTGQGVSGVWVEVINEADNTQRSAVLTDAIGRYTANLSGIVTDVVFESGRTPLEYRLEQNYPNPFNPSTAIVFHVPEPSEVTLVIYNTLGQKIRTLVNRKYSPGAYTAVWDAVNDLGQGVSAGVYFYRLQVKDRVQTRKMVLLDGYAGGHSHLRGGTRSEAPSQALVKKSSDLLITIRSSGARIRPFQESNIAITKDDFQYDIDVDVLINNGLNPDLIAVSEPDQNNKVYISGMSNAVIDSLEGTELVSIINLGTGTEIAATVSDDRSIELQVLNGQIGDVVSLGLFKAGSQVGTSQIVKILDNKPPVVTTTKPTNGEKDIVIGTRIYVHFSEPVVPATVNSNSFNLVNPNNEVIAGNIELLDGNTVAVFAPQLPLAPNTTYSITVTSEVQDVQGLNLQSDFDASFTTGSGIVLPYQFTQTGRNTHYGNPEDIAVSSDGTVFMATDDNLRAYSLEDGSLVLKAVKHDVDAKAIAVGENEIVFVVTGNDGLRAYHYDGTSFSEVAHTLAGGYTRSIAVASDGTVFVGIHNSQQRSGQLRAYILAEDGFREIARINNSGTTDNTAPQARKIAVAGNGFVFLANGDNGLRVYRYEGASFDSIAYFNDGHAGDVVIASDSTAFVDMNGRLMAFTFDSTSASLVGQMDGGSRIAANEDGSLITASLHSYGFDGTSFTQLAHFDDYGHRVAVAPGGVVYLLKSWIFLGDGGENGLWAYRYDGTSFNYITHISEGGHARRMAVGSEGSVFLANGFGGLRAYHHDGVSLTDRAAFQFDGELSTDVAIDDNGTIFLTHGRDGLLVFDYDGTSLTNTAHIDGVDYAKSVAIGAEGIVYITDRDNGIRAYRYDGSSLVIIGRMDWGGFVPNRIYNLSLDLAVGSDGTLFLAYGDGGLRALDFDGSSFTEIGLINNGGSALGLAIDSAGTIFLANGGDGLRAYTFDGDTFTNTAHIRSDNSEANAVSVSPDGNVFLQSRPVDESSGGLWAYQYDGLTFTPMAHAKNIKANSIAVAADGSIFLAGNGLFVYRFEPK